MVSWPCSNGSKNKHVNNGKVTVTDIVFDRRNNWCSLAGIAAERSRCAVYSRMHVDDQLQPRALPRVMMMMAQKGAFLLCEYLYPSLSFLSFAPLPARTPETRRGVCFRK